MKLKLLLFLLLCNVISVAQAKHKVTLSFTAPTGTGITGYNMYRGTTAGGESTTPLNSVPFTTTTYVDTTVVALTQYFYVVKAVCASCIPSLSGPSNEVSATVPADGQPPAPTGLVLAVQ